MAKKLDKKGFTLIELIIVVAILAVLVGLFAPNTIKYLEQSKVSKDIGVLDVVRDVVNAEIADEVFFALCTDENLEDDEINGKYLSEIYEAMEASPKDGKWGTLGYGLFAAENSVLPENCKGDKIFTSRLGKGSKIKIYLNGSGGVAAVGVDSSGKIIKNSDREYIVSTRFSDDELAKLDCR